MRKDYSEQTMMEQQLDRRLQEENERKLPRRLWWQTLGHYTKAFLVYAVVCAVLCVGTVSLLHKGLADKVTGYANDAGAETVAQTRATVGAMLENTLTTTRQMVESGTVHEAILAENATGAEQTALLTYFDNRFADTSCVDSIYVLNRTTGVVYASNGITSNTGSFFDRAGITLFTTETQGKAVISRQAEFTLFSQKYLRRYLTVAVPLVSEEEAATMLGGIVVNVDEEKLMSLLQASDEQKECLYIVDATGIVVAQPDSAVIGTGIGDDVMRRLAAADTAHIRFTGTVKKEQCLINAEYMPLLGLYIVSAYPTRAVDTNATGLCLAAVPLLLLALLLGYFVANWAALSAARHTRVTRAALSSLSARELAVWSTPQNRLLSDVKESIEQEESRTGAKRSEIVLGWAQGAYTNEEVCTAQLQRCGIQFTQPEFISVVICLDDLANLRRTYTPRTLYLLKRAIMKSAQDVFSQRSTVAASANADDHVVLILNCAAKDDIRWICTALKNLQSDFFAKMNVQLSCGVGNYQEGVLNASVSYRNALRALAYRLMQGRESIISYDEIAGRESNVSEYSSREALAILHGKTTAEKCAAVDAFIRLLADGSAESAYAAMQRLTSAMAAENSAESLRAAALLRDAETLRGWKDILLAYANGSMTHLRMATAHAEDIITVSEQASEEGRSVGAVLKARLQKKNKPQPVKAAMPKTNLAAAFGTAEKPVAQETENKAEESGDAKEAANVAAVQPAVAAAEAPAEGETTKTAQTTKTAKPKKTTKSAPIKEEAGAVAQQEKTADAVADFAEILPSATEKTAQETQATEKDAQTPPEMMPEKVADAPVAEKTEQAQQPQKRSFFSFLKGFGAQGAAATAVQAAPPAQTAEKVPAAQSRAETEKAADAQKASSTTAANKKTAVTNAANKKAAAKNKKNASGKTSAVKKGAEKGTEKATGKTVTKAVDTKKDAPKQATDETVQRACRYIQEHSGDAALSVDAIAAELSLSAGYFRTMFKKEMGVSPSEYIVTMRLDIAKKMLVDTDMSGKEIADSIGYEFRYFYSLFKNRTGMTVKEYRSQNGKGGTEAE